MPTTLVAPLSGWCAALDESPDPVFRERMLGDGVSIDPTSGEVFSPCDARVHSVTASAHALTLSTEEGAEVLIHIGIDTVRLNGDGFEARVKAGDVVKTGDLLLRFDLERLARAAPSLRSPVLLLKRPGLRCRRLAPEGPITAGDALLRIEHDSQAPGSEHKTPASEHNTPAGQRAPASTRRRATTARRPTTRPPALCSSAAWCSAWPMGFTPARRPCWPRRLRGWMSISSSSPATAARRTRAVPWH